jgi:hypothetical protein
MKLTPEEIEQLTADPVKADLGMPTLEELDYALKLLSRRYGGEAFLARRKLKWIVRKMNKHYDVQWKTPWD